MGSQIAPSSKTDISPMQTRMKRHFRIRDAIVLVAATGFGLAGCRFWFSATDEWWGDLWAMNGNSPLVGIWISAVRTVPVASILLLSWTMAILLLRLRGTRPPRRHLWCQPGFLACVAAVFVFAWKSVGVVPLLVLEVLEASPAQLSRIDYGELFSELAFMLLRSPFAPQANVGAGVLLVWLVTWASGRFRPEPSWVDRAGRVLGAVWVCISPLTFSAIWG